MIMNSTVGYLSNASSILDNHTAAEQDSEIDIDVLLERLRAHYIKEFYGEHFQLIFGTVLVVSIIGYITNTLNLIVFPRLSLSNSMNLFLFLLAVSDIFLITTQFAHVVHYFQGFTMYPFYSHYVFSIAGTFFESIFENISNWMLAVVGLWRYAVITWPDRCAKWFTPTRIKVVIGLIVGFSILLALPMFLCLTYQTLNYNEYVFYEQTFTDFAMSNHRLPLKIYWGFLMLRGLVPMIVMGVTTVGLTCSMCKTNQDKNKDSVSHRINLKITIMLVILLVLFLLSNLPDSFMFLVVLACGGDKDIQSRYREATDVIRVFMLTNNALSFFIYYGLSYEFRQKFNYFFCRCCLHKTSDVESVRESTVENAETVDVGLETKNHPKGIAE